MTKPTLAETNAALEGSIRKWEKIVDETGEDLCGSNCPLCQLFPLKNKNCNGCPVAKASGYDECIGTPYIAWSKAVSAKRLSGVDRRATTPRLVELARAELAFLKSLRRKPGKAKA